MMLDISTPMTFFAPALAANIELASERFVSRAVGFTRFGHRGTHRIPVPQPTSRTTLSLLRVWDHERRFSEARRWASANALEQVLVVPHRVAVAQCSDLVLEHLLVDSKVRVRVGVVVGRSRAGLQRRGAGWSGGRFAFSRELWTHERCRSGGGAGTRCVDLHGFRDGLRNGVEDASVSCGSFSRCAIGSFRGDA